MTPGSAIPSAQAPTPGAEDADAPGTIEIEPQPDGSFTVSQDDGDPQPAKSVDEVCALVQQLLGGAPQDPKAAWQAEAQGRDSTGMPAQPAGPSMSM